MSSSAPLHHSVWRPVWIWLLLGAVLTVAAFPLDGPVDAALRLPANSALTGFATACSKVGEGWVVAVAGLAAMLLFALARRPLWAAHAFWVMLTSEVTGFVGLILRLLIGRTRPSSSVPQGFYGIWRNGQWIIGRVEFSSFPSGHAATAIGLAAAVWLVDGTKGRRWGLAAAAYALLVVWSRVALGWHHLSDVVASLGFSVAGALLMKEYAGPWIERRLVRPPAPRPEQDPRGDSSARLVRNSS